MKTAICTGISGSGRIDYLTEVEEYAIKAGEKFKRIDAWEELNKISRKPIDEATILNLPTYYRMSLLEQTYEKIAQELDEDRKQGIEKCVVVATHACFHWKTGYLEAFPSYLLEKLRADVFVTIVHNIKDIKSKLDKDFSDRFVDINYTDILYWRDREISETGRWAGADVLRKDHFIIARNEPPETLYKILFEEKIKKVYFSYPMSYVPLQEIEMARELIGKLRKMGYVVFDPGSIDDAKFVDELLKEKPDAEEYKDLGKDADNQTVKLDYMLIDQSDLVIVRYPVEKPKPNNHADRMYIPLSAGVICEMVHGYTWGKRVYAIWLPEPDPSPFFAYHCRKCCRSEQELIDYLKKYEPSSQGVQQAKQEPSA